MDSVQRRGKLRCYSLGQPSSDHTFVLVSLVSGTVMRSVLRPALQTTHLATPTLARNATKECELGQPVPCLLQHWNFHDLAPFRMIPDGSEAGLSSQGRILGGLLSQASST